MQQIIATTTKNEVTSSVIQNNVAVVAIKNEIASEITKNEVNSQLVTNQVQATVMQVFDVINPLKYAYSNQWKDGLYKYFLFIGKDSEWYVLRLLISDKSAMYAHDSFNYPKSLEDCQSLKYNTYDEEF